MYALCQRTMHRIYDYLRQKNERLQFENAKEHDAPAVQTIYDETSTYHDGKWLTFEPTDTVLFEDFIRLLAIKRKPNRK